jgi:hypothetical protein
LNLTGVLLMNLLYGGLNYDFYEGLSGFPKLGVTGRNGQPTARLGEGRDGLAGVHAAILGRGVGFCRRFGLLPGIHLGF